MGALIYHKQLRATRNLMAKFERESLSNARYINRLSFSFKQEFNFRTVWEIPDNLEKELDAFVGQTPVKEALEIAIISAIKRRKPIDHIMFAGSPGLGKSTLARKVASVMNLPFYSYTGQSISKAGELSNLVKFIQTNSLFAIIFIDEIHSIKRGVSEELYEILQDFSFHGNAIKPFTCIAATTSPGSILKPLRDRFSYVFRLKPYSNDEIKQILTRVDRTLPKKVAELIAARSNGIPRVALSLYRGASNIATYCDETRVAEKHCLYALKLGGVDELGLKEEHIQVLRLLRDAGNPVGRSTICAALDIDDSELVQIIEPILLSNGLIVRVPRGREITNKGLSYINSKEDLSHG